MFDLPVEIPNWRQNMQLNAYGSLKAQEEEGPAW